MKKLLESANAGLNAVNDPARTEIGMPDFVVLRQPGNVPIGIVEAKDIGNQLSRTENSQQLKRYKTHGNLILTDYLEFRWYVDGEKRETVRIAKVAQDKIVRIQKNYGKLTDMLRRFALQTTPTVNSAKELAERLASGAQLIAHFIEKDLKSNDPTTDLVNQMTAFEKTLLPGLDQAKFADMYAQTLAYGLFASRVNYQGDPTGFTLRGAAEDIPRTNPFLRDLFYHSRFDLGSRLTWMVESLVEVLRHTDMDSILTHFGRRTQQTDPVVHFYETFLSAYNPTLREKRGVYYTPEPVVKYIVRSVDHILKTRFNRPRGLADKDALILDPAVGTGTFLYFVIEQIKERFVGQQGLWKSYVQEHLLPRVFGFELLMAPYTVAHMNLSLQLKEAGYEFKEDERLGIYLTNSLEEGVKEKYKSAFGGFIEEEANEATAIKRDKPIMVVLGNPPYSGHSANRSEIILDEEALTRQRGLRRGQNPKGPQPKRARKVKTFIGNLLDEYKTVDGMPLGEKNPKWLQDDYVKFIRFGQWRIEQTGEGILALITNNGYLDNPTFRGMRHALLHSFSEIYILNLHGDSRKEETSPDGNRDENVFDIVQGVAIILLIKSKQSNSTRLVNYQDLWGTRKNKYEFLNLADVENKSWDCVEPVEPYFLFRPFASENLNVYAKYSSVTKCFNESSMAITIQKKLVSFSADSPHAIRYRVFDTRYTNYEDSSITRRRFAIMRHLHEFDNLALVTLRRPRIEQFGNFWVTDSITDKSIVSSKDNAFIFPLYLYYEPQDKDAGFDADEGNQHERNKEVRILDAEEIDYFDYDENGRRPNLSKTFVSDLETKLGLPFQTEGSAFANGDSPGWFGPEDVFFYAYAVFHSPTYRERYAEFLKIDFPRLPLTSDVDLFAKLVRLGAELVSLHLMKSPKLVDYMTDYNIEGENEVARGYPKYIEKHKRVHINKTQYFEGVPQEIWDFHIGGYQVLQKWLKDRRGRVLSTDDLEHYQQIVVALSETIRIMQAIDEAIPQFPIE
ncbi:MAG: N-6 DNA methylase [Chloroflexi bacterium]|nr:N-6 DNA methylase [Chloroflexota bacterium]